MNKMRTKHVLALATALILGCLLCTSAFASNGGPVPVTHSGTVQNIDYLHHAITVNGHTYAVAANASYSGVAGFSVLHIGMPISYVISHLPKTSAPPQPSTAAPDDPPVITRITWLPGGI